jgi:hypothetical protein
LFGERQRRVSAVSVDVVGIQPSYGLELVDVLTGGPLVGPSFVEETTSSGTAYLAQPSRWVFQGLNTTAPANFEIRARHYLSQTLVTGSLAYPNPTAGVPPNVVVVPMMPRTGYPFSPTLTRVVGLVRLDPSVDLTSPPVPNATVVLTPSHYHLPPPPPPPLPPPPPVIVPDAPVTVTTTEDGQYTYWFLPELGGVHPPIANQLSVQVTVPMTTLHGGTSMPFHLTPNGVTYAPTVLLVH